MSFAFIPICTSFKGLFIMMDKINQSRPESGHLRSNSTAVSAQRSTPCFSERPTFLVESLETVWKGRKTGKLKFKVHQIFGYFGSFPSIFDISYYNSFTRTFNACHICAKSQPKFSHDILIRNHLWRNLPSIPPLCSEYISSFCRWGKWNGEMGLSALVIQDDWNQSSPPFINNI